jgi:hypothetical protein
MDSAGIHAATSFSVERRIRVVIGNPIAFEEGVIGHSPLAERSGRRGRAKLPALKVDLWIDRMGCFEQRRLFPFNVRVEKGQEVGVRDLGQPLRADGAQDS